MRSARTPTPRKIWGRDRFMPTNTAFLPSGDFLVTDGYGSYHVHRYSHAADWQTQFGGPGKGNGKFDTPHGIWIDDRPGRTPSIVVADRAHHTLQYLTLDGEYIETVTGFGLPANISTYRDLMVVPELFGRVSLLGKDNRVVARLAMTRPASARTVSSQSGVIRGNGNRAGSCTLMMHVLMQTAISSSPNGSPPDASPNCSA